MRALFLCLLPLAAAAHQFQLFAPAPTPTASGSFTQDFDPSIYGPVTRFSVFSATGDAIAYANVSDRHIDIHYSSASSGIGQLPGLPILTVDLPLLAPPAGQPDIDSVTALSDTSLQVDGVNFTSSLPVAIDGVAVASVQFVSSSRLTITLAARTELTGKHLHVGTADYFIAATSGSGALQFVPSLQGFTKALATNHQFEHGGFTELLAILNPGFTPVTAVIHSQPNFGGPARMLTLAPGELQTVDVTSFRSVPNLLIDASAPIRILNYAHRVAIPPNGESFSFDAAQLPPFEMPIQLSVSQTTVSWSWQTGTTPPPPATITLDGNLPFTSPLSSVPWLAIATSASSIILLPNTTGLAPGTYHTTVTLAPNLPGFDTLPTTIDVTLTVSTAPLISATAGCCAFFEPVVNMPATGPITLNVVSNGNPVDITAAASGAAWLSVTPNRATTPGTLTVSAKPEGLNLPTGTYTGTLTVQGPSNTLTFQVSLMVIGGTGTQPPPTGPVVLSPTSLAFALDQGSGSASRSVAVGPPGVTYTATSDSSWLSAVVSSSAAVTVSAANLAPGTYQGNVKVASDTVGSAVLPVTLTVLAKPSPQTKLTVTPVSISLTTDTTKTSTQSLTIDSGGTPVLVHLAFQNSSNALFGQFTVHSSYQSPDGSQFLTPATIDAAFGSSIPGIYTASLAFTAPGLSTTVPVMLTVSPSPAMTPQIANVVSGASLLPGSLAPGEIFTVFGFNLGPGSQLLVNGAAAEIFYASSGQLNAVVPADFNASGPAMVEVDFPGVKSATVGLPVAAAAPAIFTLNGSGVGPAAVLNQDNSINTPSHPAGRGTILQIFTTGGIPEKVAIGGVECVLTFNGPAPDAVRGLFQVNAVIPASAPVGTAVPIVITIGGSPSPPAATVAIE